MRFPAMGVTNLWPILEECGESEVDVRTLTGQTIAVDLSCWIVELQNGPSFYMK